MKLIDLMALHLKDVLERIDAGKLSPRTKFDYLKLQGVVTEAKLRDTDIDILGPAHFQRIIQVVEGREYSLRTQCNIISSFKSMFNWAGPNGMNLMVGVVYGPRFKGPSKRAIESQQEERSPSRFIESGAILSMLEEANLRMRVAILLGINCGFYPSDTMAVSLHHFNLKHDPQFHCFRRVKTLQKRRAVLWPETVEAIRFYCIESKKIRKIHCGPHAELLVSRDGLPFSPLAGGLTREFRRLAIKHGLLSGVGLGSLRHTFATVIDTIPDQSMIDLAMGHTNPSIQKRVYRQLNVNELDRLSVLANTVHQWLFGKCIDQLAVMVGSGIHENPRNLLLPPS